VTSQGEKLFVSVVLLEKFTMMEIYTPIIAIFISIARIKSIVVVLCVRPRHAIKVSAGIYMETTLPASIIVLVNSADSGVWMPMSGIISLLDI